MFSNVTDNNSGRNSEKDQHRIHLVHGEILADPQTEEHAPATLEEVSPATNNRIEIGEFIADILVDRRSFPTVVHWIVQRRGSPEILQWGHEDDFEAASREAVAWIDSLVRYDEYRKNVKR